MNSILLTLTCANNNEALLITNALLTKRLIACAKMFPVSSHYVWQDAIEQSEEIMLFMESTDAHFQEIEEEVRKLHSYKTFVLLAQPITHCSKGVEQWLKESIR